MSSQMNIFSRVVIFEQLILDNLCDNFFFLFFHWSKTMERKKGRDRI